MIFTVITERRIFLSVKFLISIDGCTTKDATKKEQIFPMLMKNNCPVFQFKDCCFEVQKDR